MNAQYVPSGHIVYMLRMHLMAVPFDLHRLKLTGSAVRVVENVASYYGRGHFTVSNNGTLVYAPEQPPDQRRLLWVDCKGSLLQQLNMRGVRNGWLDSSFADRAVKAWQAIARKIDADGTVHGICRGTEIGETLEFYFERQTFDHDPLGLGALIFAGIEVTKMRAALER